MLYTSWLQISRGLMTELAGPSVEDELQWDTSSAFTINVDTPWDILRTHLLWSIWCQRVAHAFSEEKIHLRAVLWHAWRNSIYCTMEAYKELFRHKQNEEKQQELITCFKKIWTASNIFGRLHGSEIRWNLTPHSEFLPKDLRAWTTPPIPINRPFPSSDREADFVARPDFPNLVDNFLHNIGSNWRPPKQVGIQINKIQPPQYRRLPLRMTCPKQRIHSGTTTKANTARTFT